MGSTASNPASLANASTPSRSRSGSMAETNPSFIRWGPARSRGYAGPRAAPVARGDRLADQQLSVPVGKCRVERLRGAPAGPDVVVDRAESLLEGVGEALVVAAGEVCEGRRGGVEQRRVADQLVVCRRALADPELVGRLAVPGERAFRARNLVADAVLPARGDLGDREGPLCPALEP